jgi:two-component system phosphate regulon sensor histidine kinase PhoR
MRIKKNSIPLTLMVSSILLLLVLQLLWLRGAYYDAADDFRKETNSLFRNTVFAMHDSLIQKSIEPMGGDSIFGKRRPRRFFIDDSVHFGGPPRDSIINYVNVRERNARVEIFMSSGPGNNKDSIQRILRPLISKIQTEKEPRSFFIRLDADSLKSDSIRIHYREALMKAGIDAPFKIIAIQNRPGERLEKTIARPKGLFLSDVVRVSPANHYAVSFTGIDGLLLKAITPQILFSVFVTLLTIGSFYFLYRNLRTQQRLMEIKNDFISNITHELKTPVATVSVALEALKNFHALDNPQRTSEYLEIAQNELSRLTLMTDKILKTAVFEDKGIELAREKIDFDSLIQEILTSLKLVFEKKKVQLTYQKTGMDFFLNGGREHLSNLLYNLVDNALKYGGDGASIAIILKEHPDNLVLSIKDDGIGIAAEYKKKIFEKFFRVPSGDIHNTKGYGLGLSYVASVVKSHDGEIEVESESGKGSCFTVTLPRRFSESRV